jgi:methylphosphotriester-DNA--protein-cysteine methyltransferase
MIIIKGIGASPGISIGKAYVLEDEEIVVTRTEIPHDRLRTEVARARVQSSSEAIERVAETTGFRDPERMRRAFIRAFGQPPQSLRRAARGG